MLLLAQVTGRVVSMAFTQLRRVVAVATDWRLNLIADAPHNHRWMIAIPHDHGLNVGLAPNL